MSRLTWRRLRSWFVRLAGVFGRGRADADISEELQAHRELLSLEYQRSGMSADEARRRAAIEFGSLPEATEAYRDRRGLPTLETLARDTRMATRSLLRTPVLSVSMIAVLSLGIGLSTAIVAVVHTIVSAELPVPAPHLVVRITQRLGGDFDRRVQGHVSQFSLPEFTRYQQTTRAFDSLAAVHQTRLSWRQDSGFRLLKGSLVAGDYFKVLPVGAALGRLLTPADARESVIVIAHRLWTDAFGGAGDVIGRTMWIDRAPFTIVGVAAPGFSGTEVDPVSVWLPLEAGSIARGQDNQLRDPNLSWLQLFGRLTTDRSLVNARAEAEVVATQLDRDYPGRHATIGLTRASRLDSGVIEQAPTAVLVSAGLVLTSIVGLLFLICGSNAAALLLARGAARQKEIALRVALGAGRVHIVRQLAAEVAVIAVTSGGLGVLICFVALRALAGSIPIGDLLSDLRPIARVFAFAFAAAFGVAALFGLAPVRQALRVDCLANLKGESSMFGRHVPTLRLRRALIVLQVTVSTVLVVIAAVLGRSVSQVWKTDPGYVTRGLFIVQPDASWRNGSRPADRGQLGREMAEALSRTPGVQTALATLAPFSGTGMSRAALDAQQPVRPVQFNQVDPAYFSTLGVPIVAGRPFAAREHTAVMVNVTFARLFWTDEQSAIGKTFFIPEPGNDVVSSETAPSPGRAVQVVGVVPTLRTTTVGLPDGPTYYTLLTDEDARSAMLVLRAPADASVPRLVQATAETIAPGTFALVGSVDARMLEWTAPTRITAFATGLVGLLALAVAAVGIHGVIAFTVTSRTREIGVYQALGARPGQVLRLIAGWTLRGVLVGSVGALVLMVGLGLVFGSDLRIALNGLNPVDPVSFLLGFLVMLTVIAFATYLPARRALGLTPLAALRAP